MRLNLGCGNDVREGYVNVDFRQTHPSVVIVDLSVLPWPFEDSSADEILMLDFLEHFPYAQTSRILMECRRILKDGGKVVVQVPDADHTMRAMVQAGTYLCNRCGHSIDRYGINRCAGCNQSIDDISEVAMQRFYGGQDYPGNFHQTCFTERSLVLKAKNAGLEQTARDPKEHDDDHFWRNWTLHCTFQKGDLW